jgi:hypothetical protein
MVMMFGTYFQTFGDLDPPDPACKVVLQASVVLTAAIYVELERSYRARARLARATVIA